MAAIHQLAHRIAFIYALLLACLAIPGALAQSIPSIQPNIEASLAAEGPAVPGKRVFLAIRFEPVSDDWHGYWRNPGDAGYGMELDWQLPAGWSAGEPLYPVPTRLVTGGLMNHIYEGSYAVLIPVTVPANAQPGTAASITVDAQWLACTDKICVPERGTLSLTLPVGQGKSGDARFMGWRALIPPALDSKGTFEIDRETLRIAVPVPVGLTIAEPHLFIGSRELGDGLQPAYAAAQKFYRDGDNLIAEIPLNQMVLPPGSGFDFAAAPTEISGILAFGDGQGVRFIASGGQVSGAGSAALLTLVFAALAGGLILNIMPCVFPILSLKALSLARAGGSESGAKKEALAYTAGVVLACAALGGLMLVLRAGGEQVGWAFQLQEPWVVIVLLVLAATITANFAELFELPTISLTRSGEPISAFATGLLAAVAATPCTGPFMAAALGAALLLPAAWALVLFAALGLGLALPFLIIGFVPRVRRMLPKPGAWMARFRKILAIPMGLTAFALIWLVSRIGGQNFAVAALIMVAAIIIALAVTGKLQRRGKMAWPAFGLISAPFLILAAFALPATYDPASARAAQSLLNPKDYSPDTLEQALASGQPVFLWFTADWCFTCKVNEGVAIEREATRDAFAKTGVIAVRADWTHPDEKITQFLTEQGVAGIPLYVWYGKDGRKQVLPQVLTPDSLVILAQQSAGSTDGTALPIVPVAGSDSE